MPFVDIHRGSDFAARVPSENIHAISYNRKSLYIHYTNRQKVIVHGLNKKDVDHFLSMLPSTEQQRIAEAFAPLVKRLEQMDSVHADNLADTKQRIADAFAPLDEAFKELTDDDFLPVAQPWKSEEQALKDALLNTF
jgi:sulfite reductase beta subunit-like hemoprotein